MRVKWKCKHCNDVVISDSTQRHTMDYCGCGKSALDLEEWGSRPMGEYEPLEQTCDACGVFYRSEDMYHHDLNTVVCKGCSELKII